MREHTPECVLSAFLERFIVLRQPRVTRATTTASMKRRCSFRSLGFAPSKAGLVELQPSPPATDSRDALPHGELLSNRAWRDAASPRLATKSVPKKANDPSRESRSTKFSRSRLFFGNQDCRFVDGDCPTGERNSRKVQRDFRRVDRDSRTV